MHFDYFDDTYIRVLTGVIALLGMSAAVLWILSIGFGFDLTGYALFATMFAVSCGAQLGLGWVSYANGGAEITYLGPGTYSSN